MAIVAKAGASFTPCPAGSHIATCVDVVDLGIVKSTFGGKTKAQHKVNVIWEIGEKRDDGKPFMPRKRYTLSLHEKASLRKDLESWRGRPFTEDELSGFDLENLIGVPCMLSVVQQASNGSIYANVAAIMRLPKGVTAIEIDPSYVRVQDRPTDAQEETGGNDAPPNDEWSPSDDDVPF